MSRKIFSLYLLCGLLVFAYVHLFSVWAWLNERVAGRIMDLLPIVVTLAVLVGLACTAVWISRAGKAISRPWIYGGVALCLLALLIPDARYAVKRIHVVEYLCLSLLVRYTLSFRLQGFSLLFFSFFVTALFGIHDELLQGILPARTYGLRDMTVNAVSAAGGAAIWYGLALFHRPGIGQNQEGGSRVVTVCYLIWLSMAVLALVVPLPAYRYESIPWWPLLPLGVTPLVYLLCVPDFINSMRHGLVVACSLSFFMLCYPLLINTGSFLFQ